MRTYYGDASEAVDDRISKMICRNFRTCKVCRPNVFADDGSARPVKKGIWLIELSLIETIEDKSGFL